MGAGADGQPRAMTEPRIAVLDVDGTLVDSNYQHSMAWYRALRGLGETFPIWRIHRLIGMGGDNLVTALAGEEVEKRIGDEAREQQGKEVDKLLEEIAPLPGARNLALARKQTIRSVLRSGFKFTFTVGGDNTVVNATLKVGRTTVGKLKSTRKGGKATLKIKLSKAGKKKLRRARRAKFALTVSASGPNVASATLKKSVTLKR